MTVLKGTHGTSVTNAKVIGREGFKRSNGLRGRGVYFWKEGPYARNLARESYQAKLRNSGFAGQDDMTFAMMAVDIDACDNGFIDFTESEWRLHLEKYFSGMAKLPSENRHKAVSDAYNLFFLKLKKTCEHDFTVVCMFVPSPAGRESVYPVDVLGHPCCYVVMDESTVRICERD